MDGHSQTVRITYRQLGTRPPVFVAGSFTTPPWEPRELQYTKTSLGPGEAVVGEAGDSDLEFFDHFKVGEGQYQYKFRIGYGDWWVCDENVETATDDVGNQNNLLTVQPEPKLPANDPTESHEETIEPNVLSITSKEPPPEAVEPMLSSLNSPRLEHAPLFAHEARKLPEVESTGESQSQPAGISAPLHSQLAGGVDGPSLETFPIDTEKILQQIETTKLRVKEDETTVKDSPTTPVTNSKHGLATPPSSNGVSPTLDSISEENLAELPKAATTHIGEPRDFVSQEPSEAEQKTVSKGLLQLDGAHRSLVKDDPTSSSTSFSNSRLVSNSSVVKNVKNFFEKVWRVVFLHDLGRPLKSCCGRSRH